MIIGSHVVNSKGGLMTSCSNCSSVKAHWLPSVLLYLKILLSLYPTIYFTHY